MQVSSVNRKSLEIVLSAPREWQAWEPEITTAVREKAARGRVQVTIDARGPASTGLLWDDAAVHSVIDRLAALAARRGVPFVVTPELLLSVVQASRTERVAMEPERALALIKPALQAALGEFAAAREREGAALATDFEQRVRLLSALVERIANRAAHATQHYRENLLSRLRQAGLEIDLNDERVLKEIALFADRIDTSEEITRLRSHLQQLATLAREPEPVGRKAEFLLQEIGREIHTIGSKANDLEIVRAVLEFKNEIERIREQVQNIE